MTEKVNKIQNLLNIKFGNAKIENQIKTTNNEVFVVDVNEKKYIFKTYKSKNWPENGKLIFVNKLLKKNNIPYAKEILYSRNDPEFEAGYVMEEKIPGKSILNKNWDKSFGKQSYMKLAKLIKNAHKISFEKYGYLNDGNPLYDSLSEYIDDVLNDNLDIFLQKNIINTEKNEFIEKICSIFKKTHFTPVLIHGDLSMRNVIDDCGNLILIDWDDAMALPWQCDVARLTFDMKFLHEENYDVFRQSFLQSYLENSNFSEFDEFEKIYHIFVAIDWLHSPLSKNKLDEKHKRMIEYLNYLISNV